MGESVLFKTPCLRYIRSLMNLDMCETVIWCTSHPNYVCSVRKYSLWNATVIVYGNQHSLPLPTCRYLNTDELTLAECACTSEMQVRFTQVQQSFEVIGFSAGVWELSFLLIFSKNDMDGKMANFHHIHFQITLIFKSLIFRH